MNAGLYVIRSIHYGFRSLTLPAGRAGQNANFFPGSVLRLSGYSGPNRGTSLALPARTMRPAPRTSLDLLSGLRAVGLFCLFMAAVWGTLQAMSGSSRGALFGPLAAQIMMGLVILAGSRLAVRGEPAARPTTPRRRLSAPPLILIALGGFMLQASILAGTRFLAPASLPAMDPLSGPPLMWVVLIVTSVVGAPLLEELFFRGLLQPLLSRRNVVVGVILTAGLFGLAHGLDVPLRILPAFTQGLLLGGIVLVTGRLRGAMVVHALNNAFVLLALAMVAFRPEQLRAADPGAGVAGAAVWLLPAYGLLGVALVAWGFVRVARQPQLPAPA